MKGPHSTVWWGRGMVEEEQGREEGLRRRGEEKHRSLCHVCQSSIHAAFHAAWVDSVLSKTAHTATKENSSPLNA